MILGTGIDIIEIDRISDMLDRHGEHFLRKTFTPNEQAYCRDKAKAAQHYAARFAAKEAGMKAFGTGWQKGIGFLSIEVTRDDHGPPTLSFHGEAATRAQAMGSVVEEEIQVPVHRQIQQNQMGQKQQSYRGQKPPSGLGRLFGIGCHAKILPVLND